MIVYKLITEMIVDRENGSYTACGISVYRGDSVIRTIADISPDREKVESLIDLFNREQLSPTQLDEAVENFLYDFEV